MPIFNRCYYGARSSTKSPPFLASSPVIVCRDHVPRWAEGGPAALRYSGRPHTTPNRPTRNMRIALDPLPHDMYARRLEPLGAVVEVVIPSPSV